MRTTVSTWIRPIAVALACAGICFADVPNLNNLTNFEALATEAGGFPSQSFRSSDIVAPVFHVNLWNPAEVDDAPYIFLGTVYGKMGAGPMILDARDLSLVYADQRYESSYSSSIQMVGDTPYLTFWEGFHSRGHANGFCLLFDQNYQLKYNVTGKLPSGELADMHEMSITPEGNVLFSTYFNIPFNISAVGGPADGLLIDSGFQEVDLETNDVLFDWQASNHFPITDTYSVYNVESDVPQKSGFDFFHINSIQKTEDGNYLVSSRHLSVLTLINGTDGSPIWVLGGRRNQFTDLSDGQATNFGWQHQARFYQNESHITLFDNHGQHSGHCEDVCKTRGLHLEIDAANMTARMVQEYFSPSRIDAGAMGGLQTLPNGNILIGWGYSPGFTEYKSDGTPVMDAQRGIMGARFLDGMLAYRVSKNHWKGTPTWAPSIAVDNPEMSTRNGVVYVSWNGATEVASWVIFATNETMEINQPNNTIAESARTGFETSIVLGSDHAFRYIAAAAVDAGRNILGSTYIIDMQTGKPFFMESGITSILPNSTSQEEEQISETGIATEPGRDGILRGGLFVGAILSCAAIMICWKKQLAKQREGSYTRLHVVD